MTASPEEQTARLGQPRLAVAPADLAARRDRLLRSDYLVVGGSARFRAEQRRRTVAAARVGFAVIAIAALFDGFAILDRQPGQAAPLLVLNGGVTLVALTGWWLVGHRLRRQPDPVAAAVTLAMVGATAATGMVIPALAIESAAYLILFPVLVTLILPWSTRSHVRWLAASAMIAIWFLVAVPAEGLSAEARADLVIVNLVALGASLAGHGLLQHAAIRNHRHVRKILQLRRRADANMHELARVHRQLEETARTDPLTGARNRLRLLEDLRIARGRMQRLGESLGIVAIDLDHFKQVNDQRGHLAGDTVLKAVVEAIQATIRAEEGIYRFGGEEFLVLIRVADPDGLVAACERLRTAVADLAIEHPVNPPHDVVTISLGGALVGPDDLVRSDDEWFGRADRALYAAKSGGRNRVEIGA